MSPSKKAASVRSAREQLIMDQQANADIEPSKTALTSAITSSFLGTDKAIWAANFASDLLPAGKEVSLYLLGFVEQLEELIEQDIISQEPSVRDWIFEGLAKIDEIDRN